MDTVIAHLTALLEELISPVGGATTQKALVGSLTAADFCVVSFYLALVVLINAVVALVLHRRREAAVAEATPPWRRRAYIALGKPLYIFIWIYGAYVAASPLLMKLRPEQGLDALRRAMDILFDLGAFVALFWFLFRATHVLESHLASWASTTPSKIDDLLVPLFGTSLRVIVVVVAIILGLPVLGLPVQYASVFSKLTSIMLIASVAILLFRAVNISQNVVLTRFDMTASDNLRARQVYTQLHVISRVIYVTIGLFAVAAVLMLFQEVRHVGTSLLASAGIVGIIGGFAAQKTLANLFAGFQIALAQPVRQDDVVVVEGEWGRVEEISLTYVIVRIWDDRRLVLPLSYFIEKPFQNWTRTSAAITGSVFFWVDYSFRVEEGRRALKEIIEKSPLWDRRFWNLQVSDATDRTIQLRVLATSSDSSKSWDLRCEIREKFMEFIQREHPESLPRWRALLTEPPRCPDIPDAPAGSGVSEA
jgi:small-conductance mechanosensitive channel